MKYAISLSYRGKCVINSNFIMKRAMLFLHLISGVRYTTHPSWGGDFSIDHFEVISETHFIPEWVECKMYIRFRIYKKHFSYEKYFLNF